MSKYSHIALSQTFRPHVLDCLRGLADFDSYRRKNNLPTANNMSKDQIHCACEALGLDLNAEFVSFHANAANAAPAGWQPTATIGDPQPAFQNVPFAPAGEAIEDNTQEDSEDMGSKIEGMGEASANNAAGAAAINAAAPRDASPYEGKGVADVLSDILSPMEGHLTPYTQGLLPGLLTPLIEAATKGPRTVTQTIVQGPPPVPGAWVPPAVNVRAWTAVRQAFGLRKSDGPASVAHALDNIRVAVCDYSGPQCPRIDPDYVWDCEILAELAAHDVGGLNAWCYGPAGTGKTEGAMQYAARTCRPFVRIAIDRGTEPADIIGFEAPAGKDDKAGTVWHDGKLTRAFRTPYCVILIDEITLLRSGALAIFQTALDIGRCLYLPTGEVVKAAQGIMILAADNTAGVGDDTGRYVDTAAVNVALSDRFAGKLGFEYLPAAREASMIAARSGLPKEAARIMTDYAALTRSKATAGQLSIGVTPRRLLGWANLVKVGIGSARAFASCVIAGCAPEDKEALLMLETSSLKSDHATIDAMARGTYQAPAANAAPVSPDNRRDNPGLASTYPADEAL